MSLQDAQSWLDAQLLEIFQGSILCCLLLLLFHLRSHKLTRFPGLYFASSLVGLSAGLNLFLRSLATRLQDSLKLSQVLNELIVEIGTLWYFWVGVPLLFLAGGLLLRRRLPWELEERVRSHSLIVLLNSSAGLLLVLVLGLGTDLMLDMMDAVSHARVSEGVAPFLERLEEMKRLLGYVLQLSLLGGSLGVLLGLGGVWGGLRR